MLWSRPASEWSRAGARASAFLPEMRNRLLLITGNSQLTGHIFRVPNKT